MSAAEANPLFNKPPSAAKLAKLAKKKKDAAPAAASSAQQQQHVCPKVPRGTRDSTPEEIVVRDHVFQIIRNTFRSFGAVGIDTPVFELKEVLTGKYGEDSKLIYELAEQGGSDACEHYALRYDLTVPFARYVATHGIDRIKRYQIGRVYRRDHPVMTRGRFREFFQSDLDIAGDYPLMMADSEALEAMTTVLDRLPGVGPYRVKLNHRRLLDGVMRVCGVPEENLRPICSSIDKLDKHTWDEVRDEMVRQKGLDLAIADRLGLYVCIHGKPYEVLERMRDDPLLASDPLASQALEELAVLFSYLAAVDRLDMVQLDLSLARGLDYYTGVIFEAVQESGDVGSIAAGGRYDHLVGMFAGKQIPAVGISIGVERILSMAARELREQQGGMVRGSATDVLVASVARDHGEYLLRKQLAAQLRARGVACELLHDVKPSYKRQIDYATRNHIPLMVILDDTDRVKIKHKFTEVYVAQAKAPELLQRIIRERLYDNEEQLRAALCV